MKLLCAFGITLLLPLVTIAQYPCENDQFKILELMVGNWKINSLDRISPGNYEDNEGYSVIEVSIEGCSIDEVYKGTLRESNWIVVNLINILDSVNFQKIRMDSEHGRFSLNEGKLESDSIVFNWSRDLGARVLRTRSVYSKFTENSFQYASYISPSEDSGWQLTHQWHYTRDL